MVTFRNHQDVHRLSRGYVAKRQRLLGFAYPRSRNFTVHNFAEDAVAQNTSVANLRPRAARASEVGQSSDTGSRGTQNTRAKVNPLAPLRFK